MTFLLFLSFVSRTRSQEDFWQRTDPPYGGDYPCDIAVTSQGTVFTGNCGFFGSRGIFRSTDNGSTWLQINSGLPLDPRVFALEVVFDSLILAGIENEGIYATTTGGDQWYMSSEGFTSTFPADIEIAPNGHIFASGGRLVFRSTDWAAHWEGFIVDTTLQGNPSWCLAIDPSGNIFTGTLTGVFKSTNDGQDWQHVTSGLADTFIKCLATNYDGDVFAGSNSGRGVFRSTDNGVTWAQINNGLTIGWVNDLVIDPLQHVFAGTNGAMVFRTTDNGDSWVSVSSGLMERLVMSLAIDPTKYLYAGTNGEGTFRTTSPTTSAQFAADELPRTVFLSQNYPNPFNPSTTLLFSIPHSSIVTLTIFDLLGREVATLVNEKLLPGTYTRRWDATGLPSGVYFYRLQARWSPEDVGGQAGAFTQTRKLVLIR